MKFITLSVLVMMMAGLAQAGSVTLGLESQLRTMQDDETIPVMVVCWSTWKAARAAAMSRASPAEPLTTTGYPQCQRAQQSGGAVLADMNPGAGGTIYYQAIGNQFIVQYQGVNHDSGASPETFQVILNNDGSIVYQYATVSEGTRCTVGIENGDGTDGLEVVSNSDFLHDDLAIRLATVPP